MFFFFNSNTSSAENDDDDVDDVVVGVLILFVRKEGRISLVSAKYCATDTFAEAGEFDCDRWLDPGGY